MGTYITTTKAAALMVLLTCCAQAQQSPAVPDPNLTPGDVLEVTARDICVPGYSKRVRNVPASVKRQAYALYGITRHMDGEYEVDHLISLELGGSNSIRNLWPESYLTEPYNAHVKDKLENRMHKLVCNGALDLATAQREIATDWITAYRKYVAADIPPNPYGTFARNTARPRPSETAERRRPMRREPLKKPRRYCRWWQVFGCKR